MIEDNIRISRFSSMYPDSLENFLSSKHIVIGAGSIGGNVIKTLAQIGVKYIMIIDHDKVEPGNFATQGFNLNDNLEYKAKIRKKECEELNLAVKVKTHNQRFNPKNHYPKNAYWWVCIDNLEDRFKIYKTAIEYDFYRLIDARMSALSYIVYTPNINHEDHLFSYEQETLVAMKNPINEGCTTKATPHCAMIAACIALQLGLSSNPPFKVEGDLVSYKQQATFL